MPTKHRLALAAAAFLSVLANPTASLATTGEPPLNTVVALGQTAHLTEELKVTPVEVVEDSRCPIEVRCVQAGSLIVRVRIERNDETSVRTMEYGSVVLVHGGVVQFDSAPMASVEPIETYKFGFSYIASEDL